MHYIPFYNETFSIKLKRDPLKCCHGFMNYEKTRLKCKSSARVKIVLKKDWIVKKSFQKLKNVEKNLKCLNFFEKIGKNQKKIICISSH